MVTLRRGAEHGLNGLEKNETAMSLDLEKRRVVVEPLEIDIGQLA